MWIREESSVHILELKLKSQYEIAGISTGSADMIHNKIRHTVMGLYRSLYLKAIQVKRSMERGVVIYTVFRVMYTGSDILIGSLLTLTSSSRRRALSPAQNRDILHEESQFLVLLDEHDPIPNHIALHMPIGTFDTSSPSL